MSFPFQLPMVLDGATGTNLYRAGMPQGVCVEQWVLEHPDAITQLQSAFVQSGSDAVYACTFSANPQKLSHYGLADKVAQLNRELVALSKQAAGSRLVGGDLSPTGLFVEPFGDTSFKELIDLYFAQATALKDAGVDFFIIETMMSLADARAAVLACRKLDLPIFVTMTVDEKGRTLSGASALSCLITLQELGICAFGLNCSYGPDKMVPLFEELAPYSKVPLIAKPNAGQPNAQNEYDLTPQAMGDAMQRLLACGVQIVGGCCGTTPAHIAAIRQTVDAFDFSSVAVEKAQHDFILANESEPFFLRADNLEATDPIECSVDMTDELLDAEEDSFDVIRIRVNTPDDALQFALNAHMARLPVLFVSDDALALKSALLLYNGRALVDSQCGIDAQILHEIAQKYGAIVY